MRTYEDLSQDEKRKAAFIAADAIVEQWIADPMHAFAQDSDEERRLFAALDATTTTRQAVHAIMADEALRDIVEAEGIESAEKAQYIDRLNDNTVVIDLENESMYTLETVV